jgi:hypothetical protein
MAKNGITEWNDKIVLKDVSEETYKRIDAAALMLKKKLKEVFQPGTGKTYKRKSVVHIASSPGSPPAVDNGILRASIAHETKRDGLNITASVGSDVDYIKRKAKRGTNVEYGFFLEVGTRHIQRRPWLVNTLRKHHSRIKQIIGAR